MKWKLLQIIIYFACSERWRFRRLWGWIVIIYSFIFASFTIAPCFKHVSKVLQVLNFLYGVLTRQISSHMVARRYMSKRPLFYPHTYSHSCFSVTLGRASWSIPECFIPKKMDRHQQQWDGNCCQSFKDVAIASRQVVHEYQQCTDVSWSVYSHISMTLPLIPLVSPFSPYVFF